MQSYPLHQENTLSGTGNAISLPIAGWGYALGEMVQALADVYGRYTGGPEW